MSIYRAKRHSLDILLDSNVWRYIVDADAVVEVKRAARKSKNRLCVPPSVLYEALVTGDVDLRQRLVCSMTEPEWLRLMPEAFEEAAEIRIEIERLRPQWIRTTADLNLFRRVRYDWKRRNGGFWDRVRNDPERERRLAIDDDVLDSARLEAISARDEARTFNPEWQRQPLTGLRGAVHAPVAGWNGKEVDWWRWNSLLSFQFALTRRHHPYNEWLNWKINLDLISFDNESLTRFWLHEAEEAKVPRQWLRSAFDFQQRFRKVNAGTPADNQLGTYLVDVDLFLSADNNMVHFAKRCRSEGPFQIAKSTLVPAGDKAVTSVLHWLQSPPESIASIPDSHVA